MITGRVINAEGQPVAGAEVYAEDFKSSGRIRHVVFTNKEGNFILDKVAPGDYTVYGSKEADGYLHTDSLFHLDGYTPDARATVFENQVTSNITVQLGPKAAFLVGRIIDATTNQPINNASITLRRIDNPAAFLLTGPSNPEVNGKGGFKLLVPPVPFTIEVKAPGYEDWTYSSDGTSKRKDALHLMREETKKLTIALRPLK